MPKTTGANYTGSQLEKFIEDRLIEKNYQFVTKDKFKPAIYRTERKPHPSFLRGGLVHFVSS